MIEIGESNNIITLLALGTSSCRAFILSAILSLRNCNSTRLRKIQANTNEQINRKQMLVFRFCFVWLVRKKKTARKLWTDDVLFQRWSVDRWLDLAWPWLWVWVAPPMPQASRSPELGSSQRLELHNSGLEVNHPVHQCMYKQSN